MPETGAGGGGGETGASNSGDSGSDAKMPRQPSKRCLLVSLLVVVFIMASLAITIIVLLATGLVTRGNPAYTQTSTQAPLHLVKPNRPENGTRRSGHKIPRPPPTTPPADRSTPPPANQTPPQNLLNGTPRRHLNNTTAGSRETANAETGQTTPSADTHSKQTPASEYASKTDHPQVVTTTAASHGAVLPSDGAPTQKHQGSVSSAPAGSGTGSHQTMTRRARKKNISSGKQSTVAEVQGNVPQQKNVVSSKHHTASSVVRAWSNGTHSAPKQASSVTPADRHSSGSSGAVPSAPRTSLFPSLTRLFASFGGLIKRIISPQIDPPNDIKTAMKPTAPSETKAAQPIKSDNGKPSSHV